jgi:hypothetical protein
MRHPQDFEPESKPNLLEAIKTFRASVGDGLNDNELTRLLRESPLPVQAGFTFLSFSQGTVTLSVPPQDLDRWYPPTGWIHPDQEHRARAIAEKYGLELTEPPDLDHSFISPQTESPNSHHHIELYRGQQTIVVAHPHYLKIRLYQQSGSVPGMNLLPIAPFFGSALLEDLSGLYQPRHWLSRPASFQSRLCQSRLHRPR